MSTCLGQPVQRCWILPSKINKVCMGEREGGEGRERGKEGERERERVRERERKSEIERGKE